MYLITCDTDFDKFAKKLYAYLEATTWSKHVK